MSAVDDVLESRRLSAASDRRHGFTVARSEALLRMRRRPQAGPWHWTLDLLRAVNVLGARGTAHVSLGGDAAPTVIRLEQEGVSWESLSVAGILYAGLAADVGVPLDGTPGTPPPERWRQLVGRALNLGLAHDPVTVELATPAVSRRFERIGEGRYAERIGSTRARPDGFEIRIHRATGALSRVGAWLTGKSDELEVLSALWLWALPGSNDRERADRGISLPAKIPGIQVRLGTHALWTRAETGEGPWLVRDGVRVVPLTPALARAGVHAKAMPGFVDCPALRLTADESDVAADPALELLVTWLHDMRAHTHPGDDGQPVVVWPTELSHIPAVSGRPAELRRLVERMGDGELLYVWPNQVDRVPPGLRASVYQLWPSELALLPALAPTLRPVPLSVLGSNPRERRFDLTALQQGSVAPPFLMSISGGELAGERVSIRARAFIHRYPTAIQGAILVLSHGRPVKQIRDEKLVRGGVTIVCELGSAPGAAPVAVDRLRDDEAGILALAERLHDELVQRRDTVLAHVFQNVRVAWDVPVVRAAVDGLGPVTLGLRYVRDGEQLRLRWNDSPLLQLVVASDRRGEGRTLGDALARCRDVGGLVVDGEASRWRTLESRARGLDTWKVTDAGERVLPRVVGDGCLWRMPTVPESHPRVRAARDQSNLFLEPREIRRLLDRVTREESARIALVGHALAARALGRDAEGLDGAPLVRRYDPRALAPVRLVSLASLESDEPIPLAFPGAVSRDLPGPVIEATPAEAALLHEAMKLLPAPLVEGATRRAQPGRVPRRRRGREVAPLVEVAVVDPLMVGALRLEASDARGGVAIWSSGLHVDDVRVGGPLSGVSGRLWLTPRGAAVGRARLDRGLHEWMLRLVRTADEQRDLLRPADPRRERIEAFLAACRADRDLARELARVRPRTGADPMVSLHRVPLQRVPVTNRLGNVLRQVTGIRFQLETAVLSWRPAKLLEPGDRANPPVVELGRRHAWIRRGLDDDAPLDVVFEAAALVLADVTGQADRGPFAPGASTGVWLYRLLALAYAHS